MVREELKRLSMEALRNRDSERRTMISGVLARFTEEEKAPGFAGWDETKEREVVERYARSLEKAIEQLGDTPLSARYQAEVDLLKPFLPTRLDEAATREKVAPLAAQAKGLGQFMGMVMKQYKGQVDPELVRRIGTELGLK